MRVGGVDIPLELEHKGRALRRQLWMRGIIGIVTIYTLLGLASYFLRLAGLPVAMLVGGMSAWTLSVAFVYWLRNRLRLDVLSMLKRLGYCSCGYKAVVVPESGKLLCPECGRDWWPKWEDPARANNPP